MNVHRQLLLKRKYPGRTVLPGQDQLGIHPIVDNFHSRIKSEMRRVIGFTEMGEDRDFETGMRDVMKEFGSIFIGEMSLV